MIYDGYLCGECREFYEWDSDARECCAPEPEYAWQCAFCYTVHDDEIDADLCCPEPNEHEDDCSD